MEGDVEAEVCAEDVAEDGVFGTADVAAAVVVWPLTVARLGSVANWADTPDELVQAEFGDPTPATKFTCMHYGLRVRNASYTEGHP